MGSAPDEVVPVHLSARLWSCIDSTTDNVISLAAVEGPWSDVEAGTAIREAGWAQVPWVDGQWPPMDDEIAISLTVAQWRFALHHLARDQVSYERIGDQESLQLVHRARAVVVEQLG